jgi:hypothetical protein
MGTPAMPYPERQEGRITTVPDLPCTKPKRENAGCSLDAGSHTHFRWIQAHDVDFRFIKEIKVESNEFVNQKRWTNHKFGLKEGYSVFSYSH